jgi:hypothetical protein
MPTGFEVAEIESTELQTFERGHFVADRIEHSPHLTVSAFAQFYQEVRFARR